MHREFIKYGKMLFDQKLVNLHSGNMSARFKNNILITRSGSQLGNLACKDILTVNLNDDKKDKGASVETIVHRAILKNCPGVNAVAHAHTPCAIAMSLTNSLIKLIDTEGSLYIPEVPVLCCEETIGSKEAAEKLPELINKYKVAIVKGHGPFAGGKDLEEAVGNLMTLESSCLMVLYKKLLER